MLLPIFPLIHVEKLAEQLGVTRDWINRKWLNSENPPPCFRDGDQLFFEVEELQQWAKRRSLKLDSTDTPTDL